MRVLVLWIVRSSLEIEPRSIWSLGNQKELTLPILICSKRGWKKAFCASCFLFWCFTRAGFFFFWQGFWTGRQSDFVKYLRQKKNAFFFLSTCPEDRWSSALTPKKNMRAFMLQKGGWASPKFFFHSYWNCSKTFFLSHARIFLLRNNFFWFCWWGYKNI